MANDTIQIIEKPDWISWEDIRECLYTAHGNNRSKGIVMSHALWDASKIRDFVGQEGKMLVVLDGKRLIGTCAIVPQKVDGKWYSCENFVSIVFASLLPDYRGRGIFGEMERTRIELARKMGFTAIIGDTHVNNKHRIDIFKKDGFKIVDYKVCSDHFNVIAIKWLRECPFSASYIYFRYQLAKFYRRLRYGFDENGWVDRFRFLSAAIARIRRTRP